jgi:MarR family transcriptional regulator, organic hydroperoxide resistance regulator
VRPRARAAFELGPALDFLQHLWALNHALERTSLQMEKTIGVTAQQRLILRCLGKYPGMTASELASVLHLDRGTISVSLSRLAKKKLVQGRRDKADQRRVALSLTPKGQSLDRPAPRTVERVVERMLTRVGHAPVGRAKEVLRVLSADLMKMLHREIG